MHRRFGNLPTQGTLAVDLSGPHIGTPLPDQFVSVEYEAHYMLAALYYPGTDISRDPGGAPGGVDASVFDGSTVAGPSHAEGMEGPGVAIEGAPVAGPGGDSVIAPVDHKADDHPGLLFSRLQRGKSAEETLASIQSVIAQVRAQYGSTVKRVHWR